MTLKRMIKWQLPPSMSDYSALHNFFYNRNASLLMLSAGACREGISETDEYRDLQAVKQYTTEINDAQLVIGIENTLDDASLAKIKFDCDFVVVTGTPVSNITGTNLNMVAAKIKKYGNKPVLTFNTGGYKSYSQALKEAYKKTYPFLLAAPDKTTSSDFRGEGHAKKQINLIGFSPIIHGREKFLLDIIEVLEHPQLEICLDGIFREEGILEKTTSKLSPLASLSLVLSKEGLALAEMIKEQHGVDFFEALPILPKGLRESRQIIEEYTGLKYPDSQIPREFDEKKRVKKVLIIGEEYFSRFLKEGLEEAFPNVSIETKNIEEPFFCEDHLASYDFLIADPLFREVNYQIPQNKFIPLPLIALSGKIYAHEDYDYVGQKGYEFFKKYI